VELCKTRREELKKAFQGAWKAYAKYAWGSDELKPMSKTRSHWLGGQGTMVALFFFLIGYLLLDY
jgi:mannosyl-oligosaccharide alpha-1,2-mannosidase